MYVPIFFCSFISYILNSSLDIRHRLNDIFVIDSAMQGFAVTMEALANHRNSLAHELMASIHKVCEDFGPEHLERHVFADSHISEAMATHARQYITAFHELKAAESAKKAAEEKLVEEKDTEASNAPQPSPSVPFPRESSKEMSRESSEEPASSPDPQDDHTPLFLPDDASVHEDSPSIAVLPAPSSPGDSNMDADAVGSPA